MSRGEEVVDAPWKSRNSDRPRDYRGARVLMRSGEGEEEGRERERSGGYDRSMANNDGIESPWR